MIVFNKHAQFKLHVVIFNSPYFILLNKFIKHLNY